jgi:YVTN family beta-propeller protein
MMKLARSLCVAMLLLACTLPPLPNTNPDPPVIFGPSEGFVDSAYTFTLLGKDSDSNNIKLRIDWGDGDTSDWTPFIHSGETTQVSHAWPSPGTFVLRAQAMDWKDSVSEWSEGHTVQVRVPGFPARIKASRVFDERLVGCVLSPDDSILYTVLGPFSFPNVGMALRTSDLQVVDSFELGALTLSLAIQPDGGRLFAGDDPYDDERLGKVFVVSTQDYTVTDSVSVPRVPTGIAVLPDQKHVYVCGYLDDTLVAIRTDGMAVERVLYVPECEGSIAVAPDGQLAYVAGWHPYIIGTSETRILDSIPVRSSLVALSPDGERLFVANRDTVWCVRTADRSIERTILLGKWCIGIWPMPGSKYAYVTHDEDSLLTVLDVETGSQVATIGVGEYPHDIAFSKDGRLAYVTCGQTLVVLGR